MKLALALLASALALALISSSSTLAAEGATKTGVIKSVDAQAKTFVVTLPARPLTFTVNDKTVITLDEKESTFDAAIKADRKAAVTYARVGDDRVASKVAVTSVKE